MHNSEAKPNDWLSRIAFDETVANYTSQRGEDRILQKLFETIGIKNKWCAEFGAADGKHRSNTWYWINKQGWFGVQIEAARDVNLGLRIPWHDSFEALRRRYKNNKKIVCFNKWVGTKGENALDQIFRETGIPKDFDLLSMDVDGAEYDIWQAMVEYKPRVMVIEYDKTIPVEIDFHSDRGSSLRALARLGREKGYELAAANDLNGVFVRKEFFGMLGISDNDPARLWSGYEQYRVYAQKNNKGSLEFFGPNNLRWVSGKDGTLRGQFESGQYIWIKPGETSIKSKKENSKMTWYLTGWLRHWFYYLTGT
ncbi:MAG: FkbM family methyltransferase [bacterium]|nr:FkbM family methyltransferase [bacterium]